MISEDLKKFLEYSKDKEEVKEKLAQVESPQEVVEYAKELGFEFTIEDLKILGEELLKQKDELTDEELEKIAGGFFSLTIAAIVAGSMVTGVVVGAAGASAVAATVGVGAVGVGGIAALASEAF